MPKNPLLPGAGATTTTAPGGAARPGTGGINLVPAGAGTFSPSMSNAQLGSIVFPILGQDGSDPLGLAGIFGLAPGRPAESIGKRIAQVTKMTLAQANTLGKLLAGILGEKPKKNYTPSAVMNLLTTAFRDAGLSGAHNLSEYLTQRQAQMSAAGTPPAGTGTHVVPPEKIAQTVYTATDIQATVDATAQKLIGRKPTAAEVQGVLDIMNSATAARAQAQGQADIAQQQQNVATQNAVYGTNVATTTGGKVSAQQVYAEAIRQGGSVTQASVAAALVSGIESNGDPLELAGGVGPAQGLFQFEPGTWIGSAGGGKNGLPARVAQASWQQQVTGFLNATRGDHFAPWGPDVVANRGNPNSTSNPAYGYSGGVQAGSVVANKIAQLGLGGGAAISAVGTGGSQGQTTLDYQTPVISQVPADPSQTEAATQFFETQRSPEYQAQNLLNVFQMIQTKLGSPVANVHVRGTPLAVK